jgi:hypothetical protein
MRQAYERGFYPICAPPTIGAVKNRLENGGCTLAPAARFRVLVCGLWQWMDDAGCAGGGKNSL